MVKIKIIKATNVLKEGEIVETGKDSAENMVQQGYAEYISKIPKLLQNPEHRFIKLKKAGKEAIEKEWQKTRNYPHNHPKIIEYDGNIGIIAGHNKLRIIDADHPDLAKNILEKLPKSFTGLSGLKKAPHYYFYSDFNKNLVLRKNKIHYGEVQCKNKYVVIPNCILEGGKKYEIKHDVPITFVPAKTLIKILQPFTDQQLTKTPTGITTNTQELLKKYGLDKDPFLKILNTESMIKDGTGGNSRILKNYAIKFAELGMPKEEIKIVGKELCKHIEKRTLPMLMGWHRKAEKGDISEFNRTEVNASALDNDLPELTERETEQDKKTPKILEDSKLIKKILNEIQKKVVGEQKTVLALFLCGSGIWVKNLKGMLNCFVNAESSAGKDYVTKAVYDLFPQKTKEFRTKITPEYLTYMHDSRIEPDWTWNGKIFYLADIRSTVLNSPAFKVMCSEGSYAGIVRDQKAYDIRIKGKPIFFVTTAGVTPKVEIINRFLSITLDETTNQTRAIMERQGKEEETGITIKYDEKIAEALALLKRVKIIIPYATKIHKNLNAKSIRMRRYHKVALDLIKCSAALHQQQREKDEEGNYLATGQDYENMKLAMRTIQIERPPLTHQLKKAYENCVKYAKESEESIKNIVCNMMLKLYNSSKPKNISLIYETLKDKIEESVLETLLNQLKKEGYWLEPVSGKVLLMTDSTPLEPEQIARFTVQEMSAYAMKELPVSLQTWYVYMRTLVNYGLLDVKYEKREGIDKKVRTYHPIDLTITALPKFEDL